MIFQNYNGYSPVKEQDFIWMAEYVDGSYLSEFDLITHKPNSFYSIDKNKLIRFGLLGQGMKFYFEVNGGIFKLNGQMIMFSYVDKNGKEYFLTGQNKLYNDIITYKDAYADGNMFINGNGLLKTTISQYNFGYKTKININNTLFNFQPIFCLPYDKPAFIELKLVSNKDMNGKLRIYRSGTIVDEIEAPLKKGYAGFTKWVIR
ncbi:hypothetical protein [Bacillus smithii]|uniref:hypothetical protein n=1 Tax=Bacillus smithii TaxID=1479 RepID=UPI002E2215B2|nr:hypothetical protein [Bacillus smithii]MED4926626.1 hypothetical protein [Bacillus smithii]